LLILAAVAPVWVVAPSAMAGQTGEPASLQSTLQSSLNSIRRSLGAPAATVAVYRCGKPVFLGASGHLTRGSHRPVNPQTPFIMASVTKTVTATMILQEVQRGRLSLNERLSRFYPKLPDAKRITIAELLDHTSGLAEYFSNPKIGQVINTNPTYRWTRAFVLSAVGKPQFAPGKKFSYTNTNYIVLGGILVKSTNRTVEYNFEKRIAGPLGLRHSTFKYSPRHSSRFPHPYSELNSGKIIDQWVPNVGIAADYWGPVWTDGGLASTARDMAKFLSSLFDGKLISAPLLKKMTTTGTNGYGYGIYDQVFDHHIWLGHDGSYGGYESENWHDTLRNVTITVLTDLTEKPSAKFATSARIWRAMVTAYDRGTTPSERSVRCVQ
jgi:D-alanyl-D-alanine carboxypeptidase